MVPVPTDATARFSLVYVFDIARALETCIGNEKAYTQIFNMSAPEELDYPSLLESFEKFNGGPFMTRPVTIDEVIDENIPLPFPLTEDTLYSGKRFSDTFDFTYTPYAEGMEKTFKIDYSLYTN